MVLGVLVVLVVVLVVLDVELVYHDIDNGGAQQTLLGTSFQFFVCQGIGVSKVHFFQLS